MLEVFEKMWPEAWGVRMERFAFMMASTSAMVAGPILAASFTMRSGVHSA
jgi:hypothetical protein